MHTSLQASLRTAALVAALALFAAPADAGTLKLKNGSTVTGKILRYDADAKTLHLRTDAGQDAQYRLDQLDARSVYLVNASLVPADDARAQLQVANFARDAGLYAHAARRYGNAEKLDPTLKQSVDAEMTKLKRMAAEMCLKNARAAIAKNDIPEAEKWLTALIEKLPDEPEARDAATMLDQHYAQVRTTRMAANDKQSSAEMQRDLDRARKLYADMVEKSKKGLQARGGSQSTGLFESAIADGRTVLREIDAVEEKYDDPLVRERAASYRQTVVDQMVDVHLHIASLQTVKTDYRGALREVNAALALDPKNERALSARARIEDASSRGYGRRWL